MKDYKTVHLVLLRPKKAQASFEELRRILAWPKARGVPSPNPAGSGLILGRPIQNDGVLCEIDDDDITEARSLFEVEIVKTKEIPLVKWFWFSFADDDDFLGGLMIEGKDSNDALANSLKRNLNPGGNAKATQLINCKGPDDFCPLRPNKFYSKYELEDMEGIEGLTSW